MEDAIRTILEKEWKMTDLLKEYQHVLSFCGTVLFFTILLFQLRLRHVYLRDRNHAWGQINAMIKQCIDSDTKLINAKSLMKSKDEEIAQLKEEMSTFENVDLIQENLKLMREKRELQEELNDVKKHRCVLTNLYDRVQQLEKDRK